MEFRCVLWMLVFELKLSLYFFFFSNFKEEEKKTPLILVVNSEGQLFVLQCKPTASIISEKTFLSTTSTSTTNPPSWASLLEIQLIQKISIPLNVTHFVINPYYTQEVWECVWEGCILEFNFLSF
ncbi:hypothetical protein HMI55_004139 [Coelomomyces lativittatus]|nr:hypothetical protein HMI55_004139 [Coelomomyces lativittatus]